jgi:subtilisin family serine protease
MSAPITMSHGGAKQIFELATDELYLRLPDGSQRVVTIPKATTPEAFAAAIEKARAEHGIEPELVLYPAGAPRNEFSRRIVTRDVVISTDSKAEADALAREGGLVFQKKLDFAPDTFVYKASTSLQALSFQMDSEAIHMAGVSTQLAKQAATMSIPNDPYVQLQWHLKNTGQKLRLSYGGYYEASQGIDINVESVWNYPSTKPFAYTSTNNTGSYIRGNGIVIGIVDDSLQWKHPDLADNVIRELQWDWNQSDNDPSPYYYNDAHGTACAGVAAARGNNRLGVSGVAPEASLVGMRLISGPSTDLDEAEAMVWKSDEIDIKSNSWGYPSVSYFGYYSLYKNGDLANAAIKHAITHGREGKGTIFTFAAGNSFEYTTIDETDPDNPIIQKIPSGARVEFSDYQGSMYTIAVGAIDSSGKKSSYSQIGSAVLVSAPSNGKIGIMTADRTGYYGYNDVVTGKGGTDMRGSGDYSKTFGGTSSACPTVSGVIALMLQKNPDLGWRDVQEILIRSAKKVDPTDADWISANRTDHVTGNATVPFHFNDKYGAGLVDAAAAVALSSRSIWKKNLGPQKSQTVTTNNTTGIAANSTVTRAFTLNGTDLRVEHVTLQLSIDNIKKGNLTITLTSPGNTTSTFCLPHDDSSNEFTNWKFMTVRNWAEMSNGVWTLTISNNGLATGNLTDADLVVYGTESGVATNPAPVVTLAASRTQVFVGSNLTLNASAIDQNADATTGTVKTLEAFADGTPLGVSENGRWTVQANEAGTFSFTVNATDSEGETSTSQSVAVEVLEAPIAAWDFDTTLQSPIPLATAVQSVRKYAANFGSGNLTFDGSFDGNGTNSNKWEYAQGQIFTTDGTELNAVADMESGPSNKALLLRGGKNIGANRKSIFFEFSMAGKESLSVSYAAGELNGGFDSHKWAWSIDGTNWTDIISTTPSSWWFGVENLPVINDLNDAPTAYLRLQVSGATAASGQNFIDNIILSASPITAPGVGDPFTVISKTAAKVSLSSAPTGPVAPIGPADSHDATYQTTIEQNLDWVAPEGGAYSMFVYAEVVEGAEFLSAPGSLLSASNGNDVLGLAESLPQTTRYDMAVSSSEAGIAPLRLKLYDGKRRIVLAMDEKLEFESGTIIGSPTNPVRYRVAYEEVEQRISLKHGWNTFTTAVDPKPSSLRSILSDYDAAEGDRVLGPHSDAVYRDGAWMPADFVLDAGTHYSLWRQRTGNSEITLLGKALKENLPLMPSAPSSSTPSPTPLESPALQSKQNSDSTDYTSTTKNAATTPSQTASSASGAGRPESTKTSSKKLKSGKKKSIKKSKNRAVNS